MATIRTQTFTTSSSTSELVQHTLDVKHVINELHGRRPDLRGVPLTRTTPRDTR
jgi:hypothetical protein